ncbi:MAG: hypothetical protein RL166_1091 [Actinomycetota bacterium]
MAVLVQRRWVKYASIRAHGNSRPNGEGIYAVINVNANSADVLEVDRQLRLSEAVMRTKVLRADEAVVNIEPVVVPEVSAEEKAADKAEEAPAKKPAAKKPAAKKAE